MRFKNNAALCALCMSRCLGRLSIDVRMSMDVIYVCHLCARMSLYACLCAHVVTCLHAPPLCVHLSVLVRFRVLIRVFRYELLLTLHSFNSRFIAPVVQLHV